MGYRRRRVALAAAAMLLPATAASADSASQPRTPPPIFVIGNVGPNMLGTTTVPLRANRFTGSWAHAMQDASRSPLLQSMVAPARGLAPSQQIAFVQSRVSKNIRWISDATEWGQHDYWATATETLAKGAGDMEDRAIVKMHALRALGFNPNDLFLTMARDQVGGPITVLVARLNGRFFVLDDTGGAPFPIESRRKEFRPLLSFGTTGVWAHTAKAMAAPVMAASTAFGRK